MAMTMYVTYRCYKDGEVVLARDESICFAHIGNKSIAGNDDWDFIDVKIKCCDDNLQHKDFWLDVIKRIEPKCKIIKDLAGEYLRIPYTPGRYGKFLVIGIILRYLWHESNALSDIVLLTKNVLEKVPNLDPLKAVVVASSATSRKTGAWGHALVNKMATTVRGRWHYQRLLGHQAYKLTDSKTYGTVAEYYPLRDSKENRYDVMPMLQHYGLV